MPNTKQNNEISSNINQVIRSQAQKSTKLFTANKNKKISIKNI